MASTSGRINSGSGNYTYFYFQWQMTGQSIPGNYTTINWQWGVNISNSAYWGSNAIKSVSGYINGGQAIGGNTWSSISGNGDHQLLSGSWTIGHNGDGTKNFGMSSTGWLYGNGNFGNSGSWDLPTIPRHASITGATGNIDDEVANVWMTYNNPAGTAIDAYLDLPNLGSGGYNHVFNYGNGASISMAPDIAAIRTAMANVNSTVVRYVIHDSLGGDSWVWIDSTITIKNDTGQANPTFTNYTFKDNNPYTSAITGNDQYLVQGESDLLITVSTANKATPNKNANMDHYTVNIGGYSNNTTYSSSADVTQDVGGVSDVTGARTLSVSAVDSRGNSTAVTKTVNILPYEPPQPNCDASRANGFDDALILTIAGSVSPLTIGGVDKNVISSTTGVQYRFATDGGSYGAWTNVSNTQAAGTGEITTGSTIIVAAQGTASSQHWFSVQVRFIDGIYTTTETMYVPKGTPIFRIGTDGYLYWQENEFHKEFHPLQNFLVPGTTGTPVTGTWSLLGGGGYSLGPGMFCNYSAPASGDKFYVPVFLNPGTYNYTTSFWGNPANGIATHSVSGGAYGSGTGTTQYTEDCYFSTAGSSTEYLYTNNGLVITQPGWYYFWYSCSSKNAAAGTTYRIGVFGLLFNKTA